MKADLSPPRDAIWIVRELEKAGYPTWAVGGAVRDALAGGRPGDWDFATAARPNDIRNVFRRTVPIGVEHGTVGVVSRSGVMYEVTTFRRDVETFGRKARVVFADRLEEDLDRRDFTINAVAWHPLTQEVVDPHGGVQDLSSGVLRTVGDPGQRFAEDWLRVLRALRFAGTFHLEIEPATWAAIRASVDQLDRLSAERMREELWKILGGQPDPTRSLELYASSGALAKLYPELDATRVITLGDEEGDVWGSLVRSAKEASRHRPLIRLAALLHASGAGTVGSNDTESAAGHSAALARNVLKRLRASNADTDKVTHLIAQSAPLPAINSSDPDLRRWIRKVGREYLNDLFRLLIAISRGNPDAIDRSHLARLHSRVAELLRAGPALTITDLAIGGGDLNRLRIDPGPRMGEILKELLERVTERPDLNERGALLDLVREIADRDRLAN